jgi:poly(A) polymerase
MKHAAYSIVKILQHSGYQALWVGGCVRDQILKKEPQDYDIATDATPLQIEALFPKTYPIGKNFGVILVNHKNHVFEVATFRTESDYTDGRRPNTVEFSTAEADAQRRDFSINGIFFDPITEQYHDFVRGLQDLRRGVLRFIGDPNQRIKEDHLRILRAVRFANRFQLEYTPETKKAIAQHASLVVHVSPERIQDELTKILKDPHRAQAFKDLDYFQIGQKILPEVWATKKTPQPADHHSEGFVFDHLLSVIQILPPGLCTSVYWAALLHDIGKTDTYQYENKTITYKDHHTVGESMAKEICNRLKFSRALRLSIQWIIHHHHIFDTWDEMRKSRQLFYFDHKDFESLLHVHRADVLGSKPESFTDRPHLKAQIQKIQNDFYQAKANKNLPSDTQDFLSGHEIMMLTKLPAGQKIGHIKKTLKQHQLEGEIQTKAQATLWVKKHSESSK